MEIVYDEIDLALISRPPSASPNDAPVLLDRFPDAG